MTLLTKAECSAMRGLAILGIMLHNYCHWLYPAVKENEYTYNQGNVDALLNALANPTWLLPVHLLSFFGHYGVPVFLFLSAYGLTMKYEASPPAPEGGEEANIAKDSLKVSPPSGAGGLFLWTHFKKLWVMMFCGFAAFIMVDRVVDGPHKYQLMDVVAQLGLFNNLLPDPDHVIWPGPYWFFGLMLQFYIVYRFLIYKRHWGFTVALMIICFLLQCFCDPMGDTLNRLRYNFIGGMLPFGLGILYARAPLLSPKVGKTQTSSMVSKKSPLLWGGLGGVSLLFVFAWSFEYQAWFWVPAAVCLFAVALVKITPAFLNNWLAWVGAISSAMFVCHPITRKMFIMISRRGDIYTGLLLYVVATFALSILFKRIMERK